MDEVRLGVIGCGGMGRSHMGTFKDIPRLKFTAASDTVADNVKTVVDGHGVEGFDDADALLDSGLVDAVLIATPHYFHPQYSIAAFQRDIHVLTEKPVSVTAKAAADVNAVLESKPGLKYAAMFQRRADPTWQRVKQIISSGQLGELQRVFWSGTSWYRTQAYYDSGTWRATWAGEGGGVLLNQCPHDLDLLVWLAGSPSRVQAHLKLGRFHDIEVEDDVTAWFEYPNGATGVFIATTGEAPGSSHWEFCGDRGRISTSEGKLEFIELAESASKFIRESKSGFSSPEKTRMLMETPSGGGHKAITQNFVNAILDGETLIAPAVEGLESIELANAMILSGIREQVVEIPLDREGYDAFLQELVAKSEAKA